VLSRDNARPWLLTAVVAAGAVLIAACGPPPAPPPPVTTTTLPVKPVCTVPTQKGQAAAASAAGASAAPAEAPPTLTGSAEITTAATEAVAQATKSGEDSVTVVAVDDRGRPSIIPAPLDQAVDVALSTAQRLDVVTVEAPSYGQALDAAETTTTTTPPPSSDPDVDKQWALAAFPFSALWACSKGAGITVGIVDSGVQGDHPDLAGRVLPGVAIQGVVQPGGGSPDVNGHGTHVAGIIGAGDNGVGIVGVAPEVSILPVRVLDSNGVGANSDIGAGITWAVDNGANVVNISIGSSTNSASVSSAVSYAVQHGVTVVAAAGNNHQANPPDVPQYPAALDDTVAVAALSQPGDNIAGYSTRGGYVDVAAPGSNIWSSIPTSTWGSKSGTSMATPHVAALVAVILGARGGIAPAAMLSRLTTTASDAGPAGFDQMFGWGRIDPIAALDAP
jgi:serine protease